MHGSRGFVRKVCLMQQFEVGRRKNRDECEARGVSLQLGREN